MSATTDTTPKPKGGWWALSPLAVFLCLYLVTSLLVNDFYKVPITVIAFLASSCYAIAITRGLNLEQRIYLFRRRQQQEHHADGMDIHPCRSIRPKRQADGRH